MSAQNASPARHIADACLWLGGLALLGFAMAAMFFWLAGGLATYGGPPEWMKVTRPGTATALQILSPRGLQLVLRICGAVFAILGLLFLYGLISEVLRTLRGGVSEPEAAMRRPVTRGPRSVLRSALKARLDTSAKRTHAAPPRARAAAPQLTATERSYIRGSTPPELRIDSIVSRCPGCGTSHKLRTIRNYICAECRGRVVYISIKTGEALPDAMRDRCVRCDAEKFAGILTCLECGHVDL